jgi:hypothetical protein
MFFVLTAAPFFGLSTPSSDEGFDSILTSRPTAQTIIEEAMREARILASDETPSSEESATGLVRLNRMLGTWGAENIMVYVQAEESFPIASGDGEYTIGSGGNFNTVRPNRIVQAWVRDSNGYDTELSIYGSQRYGSIRVKAQQGIPSALNYTPSYPLARIRLANVPQDSATLFIVSEKTITQLSSLSAVYEFPPEYREAVVFNLAVRLCIAAGKTPRDELKEIAISSKDTIRKLNLPEMVMSYDGPGRHGGFNIYTGGFN